MNLVLSVKDVVSHPEFSLLNQMNLSGQLCLRTVEGPSVRSWTSSGPSLTNGARMAARAALMENPLAGASVSCPTLATWN